MLDSKLVIEKMKERGFEVVSTNGENIINLISNTNSNQLIQVPRVNVVLDIKKNEFSFIYVQRNSINFLESDTCGSIMNDKHFNSLLKSFMSDAIKLFSPENKYKEIAESIVNELRKKTNYNLDDLMIENELEQEDLIETVEKVLRSHK